MSSIMQSDNPFADIIQFTQAILSLPEERKRKLLNLMNVCAQRNTTGDETWVIWVDRLEIFHGNGLRQVVFNNVNCHVALVGGSLVEFTTLDQPTASAVAGVLLTFLYLEV